VSKYLPVPTPMNSAGVFDSLMDLASASFFLCNKFGSFHRGDYTVGGGLNSPVMTSHGDSVKNMNNSLDI
jgi:hypothetical protein